MNTEEIMARFEERCAGRIEAQRGKPFEKEEIEWDWNDRGNFTRKYAHSVNMYAMQAFHLGEGLDTANEALRELFEHYLAHETDLYEAHSFHWSGALYARLWSFFSGIRLRQGFGETGSRLDARTRALMLEVMYRWAKKASIDLRADTEHIWRFANSENHHSMGVVTAWFFCGVIKEDEEYTDRQFEDGRTAWEHYVMWSAFLKAYFRSRAANGQTVEIASKNYNAHTVQNWYTVYDFAEDDELRRMAGEFLDLYWASWAEEQIDSVRGGGKTRIYQGPASRTGAGGAVDTMVNLYLDRRDDMRVSPTDWVVITSGYRLPELVVRLALEVEERGAYEVTQRCMGLQEPGLEDETNPPLVPFRYNGMREDFGGFLRYSYCTPEFVMGTLMMEARPREDWSPVAAQNRWQGVIFKGHPDAAIVPECLAVDTHLNLQNHSNTVNQHWSVQKKGTLITQKLETGRFSYQTGESRVWISSKGLSEPVERDGWVFVESEGAYAGVTVISGKGGSPAPGQSGDCPHCWDEVDDDGRWLRCLDDLAVIVIEVGRKGDYADGEAFQGAVLEREIEVGEGKVVYRGLGGDEFAFYSDYSGLPEINGEAIDLAPEKVYDSPFVGGEWGSGIVSLRYGGEEKVLEFG
ncbi:TPA: hypothetical protein DCE37_05020 [Candidatus Latescibacteria bacterium]|nr:hypothetical protein [Candidatus Latescibacterota bacterium]